MCKVIGIVGGNDELQHELKDGLVSILKESKYDVDASPYCDGVNANLDFYIVYNNTDIRNFFELSDSHDVKFISFSDYDSSVLKELKNQIVYTIDNLDIEDDVENIFDKII